MKTAEERNKIKESNSLNKDIELIKQIQLDAMKEGARRAARITMEYSNCNDTWGGGLLTGKSRQILTTAENWTIKDL